MAALMTAYPSVAYLPLAREAMPATKQDNEPPAKLPF
jgi:hypothetical protein